MVLSGFTYTCTAGETFDSVALQHYGDEKYACELLNANPALCRVVVFAGGEQLLLPVVETVEDESGNEYAPVTAPWK